MFGSRVMVETDPQKQVLERIYAAWRPLFHYWSTAQDGKTQRWVCALDVALFACWTRGDLDGARRLLVDGPGLQRIRKAVRRRADPSLDHAVPGQVASSLERILASESGRGRGASVQ